LTPFAPFRVPLEIATMAMIAGGVGADLYGLAQTGIAKHNG